MRGAAFDEGRKEVWQRTLTLPVQLVRLIATRCLVVWSYMQGEWCLGSPGHCRLLVLIRARQLRIPLRAALGKLFIYIAYTILYSEEAGQEYHCA